MSQVELFKKRRGHSHAVDGDMSFTGCELSKKIRVSWEGIGCIARY